MNVFTDASLNERQSIAGVGVVFVSPSLPETVACHNSYCSANNIETAELFAIAVALQVASYKKNDQICVVSDSVNALQKIRRIFQHPQQKQINNVTDSFQKKILFNISASFSRMKDVIFSFRHVNGHQKKAPEYTDGYYNMIADYQADIGRVEGEKARSCETGDADCHRSIEEKIVCAQAECIIVPPCQLSFVYRIPNAKSKVVACARRIEKVCPRVTGRTSGYCR